MLIYTGKLNYPPYAVNELLILILPRTLDLGDPVLAYWQWSLTPDTRTRNTPHSIHGLIDRHATPRPGQLSLGLFYDSPYHLDLLLPSSASPLIITMTVTSSTGQSGKGPETLHLKYVDDGLGLCRVYSGTLRYFDYALGTQIVFVVPRGFDQGERINAYWQWNMDAFGVRKKNVDYYGMVDKSVTIGDRGQLGLECFEGEYYTFAGVLEGDKEVMRMVMWNKTKTDRSADVELKLSYCGALLRKLLPTVITPQSSTPPRQPTLETSDPNKFLLPTEFREKYVIHTSHSPLLTTTVGTSATTATTTWTDTKRIGSGGFGVVMLQQSERGNLRAVKKLPLGMRVVDYNRELRALAALSDRTDMFVKFLGWYRSDEFVYIAMEYLQYGDLGEYIKTNPKGASENAKELTRQLLRGLDVLHKRKIAHRDLKPPNVLLVSLTPIRVKITDFGISKQMAGTALRTRCGTPGYIAPEIMGLLPRRHGDVYTNAIDMWALGTILHELLVRQIPFSEDGDTDDEMVSSSMVSDSAVMMKQVDSYLLYQFCSGEIKFPEEVLVEAGVEEAAIELVKGLLVPEPAERWGVERAMGCRWLR